ncbi:Threonine dehydrogenase [Burkholderia dolosa AU0158]|nr:Threonine dehydrogenase [Burkholderia dolosa AU0158]
MLSVICESPGVLRVQHRDVPVRGRGEVLLRVRRVGICGTDLHIFTGNQPYLEYPRVMGHELSAVVAEADPDSGLQPGDAVYVMPYLSCGQCVACRQGKTNCCVNIRVLGVHCDGALAEYLSVPVRFVHKADGISLDQAAMLEFLAIGAHAVRRADVRPGQRTLVVGAGPIGMAAMIFAKLRGAVVTCLDTRADRLAFCRQHLGVDADVELGPDAAAHLASLTDGEYFDAVFDATGNLDAMNRGFEFVAHGGKYTLISIVRGQVAFSRSGVPQAGNDAARESQCDGRGFRDGARRDARVAHSRSCAEHAPDAARGCAGPAAGAARRRADRREGARRMLSVRRHRAGRTR